MKMSHVCKRDGGERAQQPTGGMELRKDEVAACLCLIKHNIFSGCPHSVYGAAVRRCHSERETVKEFKKSIKWISSCIWCRCWAGRYRTLNSFCVNFNAMLQRERVIHSVTQSPSHSVSYDGNRNEHFLWFFAKKRQSSVKGILAPAPAPSTCPCPWNVQCCSKI